jgi:hypothetical protein
MSHPKALWQPTFIARQENALKTGTRTIKVVTDQGSGYLKALGNPEGPHVLACDLLGTQLARWLGLPTFEFALIEVRDEYGLTFHGGARVSPGPAFITKYDPGDTWGGTDRQLDQLINPDDITRLVILDTWTLNCDRYAPEGRRINRDNVFLSEEAPAGRFLLRAMDHSHCFTCGKPLSRRVEHIDQIRDERIYGLFPEFQTRLDPRVVRDTTELLGRFRREDAETMTQAIPSEWDVDRATRNALVQFLTSRAGFLAGSIMDKLCPTDRR